MGTTIYLGDSSSLSQIRFFSILLQAIRQLSGAMRNTMRMFLWGFWGRLADFLPKLFLQLHRNDQCVIMEIRIGTPRLLHLLQMIIITYQMYRQPVEQLENLPLTLGPLVFHENIPNSILAYAHSQLQIEFGGLNPLTVTELSLSHNKYGKHFQKLKDYQKWLKSYNLKRIVTLNCSNNSFIMLKHLHILQFCNLENLILSEYIKFIIVSSQIESVEVLVRCQFPNLSCLVLYNNNIVEIQSLRKMSNPFLTDLIIDNNMINSLQGLSEGWNTYIQKIEINNNRIVSLNEILKCSYSRLQDVRLDNTDFYVEVFWTDVFEKKMKQKFEEL